MNKNFECKPRCEFLKLEGLIFGCNKCIKQEILNLTLQQKEEILAILNK
jgi:hypothetical protein